MPTLEERVAYLEGQVSEQTHALVEVREAIRSFEHRMDARFEGVDHRFESIDRRFETIDRRFEAIDRRFETFDRRFEAIDRRFEAIDRRFDTVDRRIDSLDDKVSRQFVWLVGLQVTTLVAIVGALLARA
jgi:chromosome segregation ATPase